MRFLELIYQKKKIFTKIISPFVYAGFCILPTKPTQVTFLRYIQFYQVTIKRAEWWPVNIPVKTCRSFCGSLYDS